MFKNSYLSDLCHVFPKAFHLYYKQKIRFYFVVFLPAASWIQVRHGAINRERQP